MKNINKTKNRSCDQNHKTIVSQKFSLVKFINAFVFCKYFNIALVYFGRNDARGAAMFGDRVKQVREAHNYSQVQLATMLHVSRQTVSNWENNNIMPSIEMLIQLADLFGVSTDFLLERDNRRSLDTTGLTETQCAHLNLIIQDILQ